MVESLKPMEKDLKVEAYISIESLPHEEPYFSLRLSTGYVFFEVLEMAEHEIRDLAQDILDMLEINIEVNEYLQGLATSLSLEGSS